MYEFPVRNLYAKCAATNSPNENRALGYVRNLLIESLLNMTESSFAAFRENFPF